MMTVNEFDVFDAQPTPAHAVAAARADHEAGCRDRDDRLIEALIAAEAQCKVHAELLAALRGLLETYRPTAARRAGADWVETQINAAAVAISKATA